MIRSLALDHGSPGLMWVITLDGRVATGLDLMPPNLKDMR